MIKARIRIARLTLLALSSATLVACGGDDDPAVAAASSPPPSSSSPPPAAPPSSPSPPPSASPPPSTSSNQAPTIAGAPPGSITQGSTYSFTPTASDADDDTLTFSVANLPAWATFSTNTGRLRGTPSGADVGTYEDITISVSDGSTTASLAPFSINVVGTATGSATLSWNPPTQNTNGSPLTNLAGYRVYWGTSQGNYPNSVTVNNPGLSSYVVEQLTPATWYFTVTAINSAGVESAFSNVASKVVR